MSYLSSASSKTDYGVVIVGNFINVTDGNISLAQDVSPNASVAFAGITSTGNISAPNFSTPGTISAGSSVITGNETVAGALTVTGNISGGAVFSSGLRTVTSVTPAAGNGIALTGVVTSGPAAGFTILNTGVTSLTAGSGISLSGSTGNITISSFGADLINVVGVTGSYTATLTDEYIGVFSANAVTITLPTGVNGREYTIKDEYGQGSGKITIQPQPGQLVDAKPNYVISVPNQSVRVVFRATSWWIV